MNDLHAVFYLAGGSFHGISPEAETGKIGGDTRHLKGNGLQRRVTPRFVIGRIDAEILAQDKVVVGHVEDAIVAGKVTWQEDELHLVFCTVVHIEELQHAEHVVVGHVMKPMGNLGHGERSVVFLSRLQAVGKILPGFTHPSGHFDECHDSLVQLLDAKQTVHGFDKDINTLVAELIAATGRDNQRVLVLQVLAQQCVGHLQHPATGQLALPSE